MTGPAKAAAEATKHLRSELKELHTVLKEISSLKLDLSGLKVPKIKAPKLQVDAVEIKGGGRAVTGAMAAVSRATGEMAAVSDDSPASGDIKSLKRLEKERDKAFKEQAKRIKSEEKEQEKARKVQERAQLKVQKEAERAAAKKARMTPLQKAEEQLKSAPQDSKSVQLTNKQLEQYKGFLRDAKLKLDGLTTSKRQLASADVVDLAALSRVNKEIVTQRNRLGEIQRVLILSGNAGKFGREGTNRLVTTLKELAEASGRSGLGGFAEKIQSSTQGVQRFTGAFKAMGSELVAGTGFSTAAGMAVVGVGVASAGAVVGVLALTSAVAALGIGLGGLITKGAMFGLRASESRQQTVGMLEALLGTSKAAQVAKIDMDNLLRDFDTSPEKLKDMSTAFITNGMRSTKMLRESMRAVVQTQSVVGEQAASKLQGIFEEAAKPKWIGTFGGGEGVQRMVLTANQFLGTGIRVQEVWKEVAKRANTSYEEVVRYMTMGLGVDSKKAIEAVGAVVERKFGKQATQAALKFDVQINRIKQNIGRMFSELQPSVFTLALKQVVDLFDDTTVAGAAMKGMVTEFYNGLYNAAQKTIPYVRIGLKGLALVAFATYIGFRPLLQQFGLIGQKGEESNDKLISFQKTMRSISRAAGATAKFISDIVIGIDKLSEAARKLTGGKVETPKDSNGKPIAGAKSTVKGGVGATDLAKYYVMPHLAVADLAVKQISVGKSITKGLARGIVEGKPELAQSIREIALESIQMFKDMWQIKSPSKVTEGFGKNISLGLAKGIRGGAPVANDNLAAIGPGNLGVRGSSVSAGGGGITIHLTIEKIEITGGTTAEVREMVEHEMEEILTNAIEKAVAMKGLRPTG